MDEAETGDVIDDETDSKVIIRELVQNPKQFIFGSFKEYMAKKNDQKFWLKRIYLISLVLHLKYPKLPKESVHLDVKIQQLQVHCQKQAWSSLKLISECLPSKLKKNIPKNVLNCLDYIFRVDIFGNVVSVFAVQGSKSGCHYDHIFPWARGGRTNSVNETRPLNIHILHYLANLRKKDAILQTIDPRAMVVGYSPIEFVRFLCSRNGDCGLPVIGRCLGIQNSQQLKITRFRDTESLRLEAVEKVNVLFEYEKKKMEKGANYGGMYVHISIIDDLFPTELKATLTFEEKILKLKQLMVWN